MELETQSLSISSGVVAESVLSGDKLYVPATLNETTFKRLYSDQIYQPNLTPEKALYVALRNQRTRPLPVKHLLTQRLHK